MAEQSLLSLLKRALELAMPDSLTAEEVKNRFIARGSQIYMSLLEGLTQPLSDNDRPPDAAR